MFFFTVLVTRLGPSPQSSKQCQQTSPCCTAHLAWLALGAREIPYAPPSPIDWLTKLLLNTKTGIKEQKLHKDLQFLPKSPKGEVLPRS